MRDLWDSDAFVDDNTLTVNINRLRGTLEEDRRQGLSHHASRPRLFGLGGRHDVWVVPAFRLAHGGHPLRGELADVHGARGFRHQRALAFAGRLRAHRLFGVAAGRRLPSQTRVCLRARQPCGPAGPRPVGKRAHRPPDFIEGQLAYDALCAVSKAANDEVAGYRRQTNDYREYVETWCMRRNRPSPRRTL